MSKIKPKIDIEPGIKDIWSKIADDIGKGLPMIKSTIITHKRKAEAIGHGDLAEGSMIFLHSIEVLYNYIKLYETYKAQGKKTVIFNFTVPPELFYMLDVYPMCQEIGSFGISGTSAASLTTGYIDIAEEAGITSYSCNAQKVWLGAILKGQAPKPDAIVYPSQPCDSTKNQYQIMQNWYKYKVPTFTLDIPYWSHELDNPYYDEDVIPYMTGQLKKLIGFLEKISGKKTEPEKMKQVLNLSNQAREYILEIHEYMKQVPSPVTSSAAIANYITLLSSAGLPSAVEYSKRLRDFAKEMVKRGLGALNLLSGGKKEEKIRVVCLYPFDPKIIQWMQRKFGAVLVQDMMGYQLAKPVDLSSEKTILEGLGKTMLDMPMARQSRGPMEFYYDDMIRIGKEYKADCFIFGGHVGCKHSWGGIRLLTDMLKEETGLPTIVFETDMVDPRVGSSPEIKRKIKYFFERIT